MAVIASILSLYRLITIIPSNFFQLLIFYWIKRSTVCVFVIMEKLAISMNKKITSSLKEKAPLLIWLLKLCVLIMVVDTI